MGPVVRYRGQMTRKVGMKVGSLFLVGKRVSAWEKEEQLTKTNMEKQLFFSDVTLSSLSLSFSHSCTHTLVTFTN